MPDESYPMKCVNCGKENIILESDPLDVKCEFGDHPARIKKERKNMPEIMSETLVNKPKKEPELVHVAEKAGATEQQKAEDMTTMARDIKAAEQQVHVDTRQQLKKCKKCQLCQLHDETLWCTSKRCPSHYPKHLRPPYRPPVSPSTPKLPKDTGVNKGNRLVRLGTFTVEAASELPGFPAFDSNWSTLVQEEWLKTYVVLRKLELELAKVNHV